MSELRRSERLPGDTEAGRADLVRCAGLEPHALVAGEALELDAEEELALILSGSVVVCDRRGGGARWLPHSDMPMVFLAPDLRSMHIVAASDASAVRLGLARCRVLVEVSRTFRALFHTAMATRLETLRAYAEGRARPLRLI